MAQPTIVGASAAATTSIAIPAHQVGDLIVIAAYRDGSTTVPTKPAASGTVPAWVDVDSAAGANLNSMRTAYFVATATNTTSGTWTNASALSVVVFRGQNATPIGAHAVSTNAAASGGNLTTTALTSPTLDGTSQFLYFFGWRTVTAWSAPPSGYTQQAQQAANIEAVTKDTTTSEASFSVSGTATASGGYRTGAIEIKGTASGQTLGIGHVASPDAVRGADITQAGPTALGIGKVASPAAVRGSGVSQAGPTTLGAGKVASPAVARGASVGQAGPAALGAGKVASPATVRGADLANVTATNLGVGNVASPAAVRGASLSQAGPVVLGLGKVPSPAATRGAALTQSGPVALTVGRVATAGAVRGATLVLVPPTILGTVAVSDAAAGALALTEAAGSLTLAVSAVAGVTLTEAPGAVALADAPLGSVTLTETPI